MENATVLTAKELLAQQRLRCAIGTLAKQQAIRRVKQLIAAQGRRVHEFTARELSILAESYLAEHREELVAKVRPLAEKIVANW